MWIEQIELMYKHNKPSIRVVYRTGGKKKESKEISCDLNFQITLRLSWSHIRSKYCTETEYLATGKQYGFLRNIWHCQMILKNQIIAEIKKKYMMCIQNYILAQSIGMIEYADWIFAEE